MWFLKWIQKIFVSGAKVPAFFCLTTVSNPGLNTFAKKAFRKLQINRQTSLSHSIIPNLIAGIVQVGREKCKFKLEKKHSSLLNVNNMFARKSPCIVVVLNIMNNLDKVWKLDLSKNQNIYYFIE
jgi:hypothetical protein